VDRKVVERIAGAAWGPLVDAIGKQEGIEPDWIRGVIAAESGGNPRTGGEGDYKGLMQAERDAEQWRPEVSIRSGARKLKQFQGTVARTLRGYGVDLGTLDAEARISLVMIAYNTGPGTLARALRYADAAGAIGQWFEPEHFQRALAHTGAYHVPGALQRGLRGLDGPALATELARLTGRAAGDVAATFSMHGRWNADGLRKAIVQQVQREKCNYAVTEYYRKQHCGGARTLPELPLRDIAATASPWLLQSIRYRHDNLRNWYVARVLAYRQYFRQRSRP
jgi:hypothetical protein